MQFDELRRLASALEGEARLLLARAGAMAGHADGGLREAEAAVKVFEREKKPERRSGFDTHQSRIASRTSCRWSAVASSQPELS